MTVMQTEVAAAEAKIAGFRWDARRSEPARITLEQNLMLPDAFTLRLADPDITFVDSKTFDIGKERDALLLQPGGPPAEAGLRRRDHGLEPEFTQEGIVHTIRGYDQSHRLNRVRKAATFQQMSAADIARKIAGQRTGSARR